MNCTSGPGWKHQNRCGCSWREHEATRKKGEETIYITRGSSARWRGHGRHVRLSDVGTAPGCHVGQSMFYKFSCRSIAPALVGWRRSLAPQPTCGAGRRSSLMTMASLKLVIVRFSCIEVAGLPQGCEQPHGRPAREPRDGHQTPAAICHRGGARGAAASTAP